MPVLFQVYRCKNKRCGLVLGLVVHVSAPGSGRATHLDVFRAPRNAASIEFYNHAAGDFSVIGLDQGTVMCTCGKSRKWDAGEDALERLLASRQKRQAHAT